MTFRHAVIALMFSLVSATATAHDWPAPMILTQDVDLFYRIYDDAEGSPNPQTLQQYYIEPGSDGERQFAAKRGISGATLAAAIRKRQGDYDEARSCAAFCRASRSASPQRCASCCSSTPMPYFPLSRW